MPGIWTTALATLAVLLMLATLLWIVGVNAFGWFWPARISEIVLDDGTVRVGEITAREPIPSAGEETVDPVYRLQLKTGNRELTRADFLWEDEAAIVNQSQPEDLVRVVRTEYGDAFGRIVEAVLDDGTAVDMGSEQALEGLLETGEVWQREGQRLEKERERLRRPLTRLEERLDLLERSARSQTSEGEQEIAALAKAVTQESERLAPRLDALQHDLEDYASRLTRSRIILESGADRIEVPLSNMVQILWANRMGLPSRVAHAVREGALFLFTEPREANTEGGIFPALFGTVLLVLLMSVAVVPLGVVTAVYMTEYARPGMPLRLANQAVNNLAGVPSIVFGMFGLAFFVYEVGGSVDRVFFADRLPTPTFGTGGVLWASLTLALLTVPVVVVATREGLLAVPQSWRDGSLALGSTRWQTLRRIILPAAMPGILTGLILAVSRAAGEVAPLMLTGAVKMAPSLPVDGTAPFLHLQRKFMHLGFHIYDVSMQSPNVEAAKPMAFATTLVLLLLVILLNLTAIVVRRRLRRAYQGQVV
ncbi:MAG: phosphate ABC transporter permease PstA [Thermoanaerobaculales bacterium]|nr:phosphate ABC transporter permease PstA [Thermoanaerobaculales bacterium]